jgi:hypothetical protein
MSHTETLISPLYQDNASISMIQIIWQVLPGQPCHSFLGLPLHKSVLNLFEQELTTSHERVHIVTTFQFT